MAEGLFLEFSASEINTIISKAKTLLTEGRNATKQFTLPIDQVLREARYALKRLDPATYGYPSNRTYAQFR